VKLEIHKVGALETAWFPMRVGASGAAGALVKDETCNSSHKGVVIGHHSREQGASAPSPVTPYKEAE
jgi:hypothetical protein